MSLLSARHKIIFTFIYLFIYLFFAAAAHPTPCRESVKRLINSSWPKCIRKVRWAATSVYSAEYTRCDEA